MKHSIIALLLRHRSDRLVSAPLFYLLSLTAETGLVMWVFWVMSQGDTFLKNEIQLPTFRQSAPGSNSLELRSSATTWFWSELFVAMNSPKF